MHTILSLEREPLFKRMDKTQVARMNAKGRVHFRFMAWMYKRQLTNGKLFLDEHPATAISCDEKQIKDILMHQAATSVVR